MSWNSSHYSYLCYVKINIGLFCLTCRFLLISWCNLLDIIQDNNGQQNWGYYTRMLLTIYSIYIICVLIIEHSLYLSTHIITLLQTIKRYIFVCNYVVMYCEVEFLQFKHNSIDGWLLFASIGCVAIWVWSKKAK